MSLLTFRFVVLFEALKLNMMTNVVNPIAVAPSRGRLGVTSFHT